MPNFFSNLFSGLFNSQSKSVLGIDIGSSSIKIVQLSRRGGRVILETYGELSLGPYAGKSIGEATNLSAEKIIEAVQNLLKEKEVNATTRICGVAIPFSSSLITVIELPNQSLKQLAEMIPIEARKYIPVPISEVALDWYVIPKDRNPESEPTPNTDRDGKIVLEKQEVLIVALHNDTITRYHDIVTKSALQATFFEIEIFSTMRYILERGILRSSHMINSGGQNMTNELSKSLGIPLPEAEILKREKGLLGEINGIEIKNVITVTLDYIFSEANRTVLAYQKKYNKNVSKVILVGGGSALKGGVDVAKGSFQTEVLGGDPFAKVLSPAFLEKVLRETGPEFAVSVGVALRCLQELE